MSVLLESLKRHFCFKRSLLRLVINCHLHVPNSIQEGRVWSSVGAVVVSFSVVMSKKNPMKRGRVKVLIFMLQGLIARVD